MIRIPKNMRFAFVKARHTEENTYRIASLYGDEFMRSVKDDLAKMSTADQQYLIDSAAKGLPAAKALMFIKEVIVLCLFFLLPVLSWAQGLSVEDQYVDSLVRFKKSIAVSVPHKKMVCFTQSNFEGVQLFFDFVRYNLGCFFDDAAMGKLKQTKGVLQTVMSRQIDAAGRLDSYVMRFSVDGTQHITGVKITGSTTGIIELYIKYWQPGRIFPKYSKAGEITHVNIYTDKVGIYSDAAGKLSIVITDNKKALE